MLSKKLIFILDVDLIDILKALGMRWGELWPGACPPVLIATTTAPSAGQSQPHNSHSSGFYFNIYYRCDRCDIALLRPRQQFQSQVQNRNKDISR